MKAWKLAEFWPVGLLFIDENSALRVLYDLKWCLKGSFVKLIFVICYFRALRTRWKEEEVEKCLSCRCC